MGIITGRCAAPMLRPGFGAVGGDARPEQSDRCGGGMPRCVGLTLSRIGVACSRHEPLVDQIHEIQRRQRRPRVDRGQGLRELVRLEQIDRPDLRRPRTDFRGFFRFGTVRRRTSAWPLAGGRPRRTPMNGASPVVSACPECEAEVSFDRPPLNGQVTRCGECRAELEVTSTNPVRLELAPEVEEDWGE